MVREEMSSGGDQQSVVVSPDEIRARDISGVLEALSPLLSDPDRARRGLESVAIVVDGYGERAEQLWQIPEVRSYLQRLDEQFPYWFYFLDKQGPDLFTVVRSVLPIDFTPDKLGERLKDWWLPAVEQITGFAEFDEDATDRIIQRSLTYLRQSSEEWVAPAPPTYVTPVELLPEEPDEPEYEDEPDERLDPVAVMGDLVELLGELPGRTRPGDDLLVYLWSVLKEKNLVRHQTQVEHVRAVASLLALHRLKTVFSLVAFEEDAERTYSFPSAELIDDYPKAEPFWIGVHAGADATFDALIDPAGGPDWLVEALNDLARGQYDEIVSMLRRLLGENALFAALLTASSEGAVYPVPEDLVNEITDGDLEGLTGVWDWLREQGR